MRIKVISTAALAVAVFTGTQYAAIQSNGAGGGDFHTGTTWNGDVAPGASADWEILPGDTLTVAKNLSVRGWATGTVGGTLDLGSFDLNLGSLGGGFTLKVPAGGSFTSRRVFTNRTIAESVGIIEVTGGTFTYTDYLRITNTTADTTTPSRFLFTGGAVNGTGEFRLFGADTDDRAELSIVGNGGTWNVGALVLYNVDTGGEDSASSVHFTFGSDAGDDALTILNCTHLTLGDNPLTIDFSSIDRGDAGGSFSTTLIDYSGTLTGGFADPVFIGLGSGESAALVHDPENKLFRVDYVLPPVPEPSSLATLAFMGVFLRRRHHV